MYSYSIDRAGKVKKNAYFRYYEFSVVTYLFFLKTKDVKFKHCKQMCQTDKKSRLYMELSYIDPITEVNIKKNSRNQISCNQVQKSD